MRQEKSASGSCRSTSGLDEAADGCTRPTRHRDQSAARRCCGRLYQLELNLTVVVGFRSEAGGGARFSPGVGTATRPPGGMEITTYDPGPEDNPSEGWAARTGQTARQC